MKIDITKIDGFDQMTADEKIAALENYEFQEKEPDYTGYVKKSIFDKTASELAKKKKDLENYMTEDEQKESQRQEELSTLKEQYNNLLHTVKISETKSKFLELGYDENMALDTANALVDGDLEKVFANQKVFQENMKKNIKADLLKNTPEPVGDSTTHETKMTMEKLKKLTPKERLKFSKEYPDEYNKLYSDEGDK